MNSQQKFINVLTMCRKAGRLVMGFDAVKEALMESNVSCIIVTEDISPNTLKEVKFVCKNYNREILELDMDSYDMLFAVGKQIVVAAICDFGFAEKLRVLCEEYKKAKPADNGNKLQADDGNKK